MSTAYFLKNLKYISKGPNSYISYINCSYKKINFYISNFNYSNDKYLKLSCLKEIQFILKDIEHKYPDSYFAKYREYDFSRNRLFIQLKRAHLSLGFSKLTPSSEKDYLISDIITNMSPNKIKIFCEYLTHRSDYEHLLNKIYSSNDQSKEAILFRKFLSLFRLEFLDGQFSKNFKITSIISGKSIVLKLLSQRKNPRDAEILLRKIENYKILLPISAERQTVFKQYGSKSGEYTCQTLVVNDFLGGGNLDSLLQKKFSSNQKIEMALSLYGQMIKIFILINKANCIFFDPKNQNWIFDKNNTLYIADTKSVLHGDYGVFRKNHFKNKLYKIHLSKWMIPPELYKNTNFNIDKFHGWMLGKNLYHFLTNTPISILRDAGKNASNLKYDDELFTQTHKGFELKALCHNLLNDEPNKRYSLKQVLCHFYIIKHNLEHRINSVKIDSGKIEKLFNKLRGDLIKAKRTGNIRQLKKIRVQLDTTGAS